jgi:hypothetical protein
LDDPFLLGGVPDGVLPDQWTLSPLEIAGQSGLGYSRVLPNVLENGEVVLQLDKDFAPVAFVAGPRLFVGFALLLEGFAGLAQLVMPVDALDGLFEANGDEEADDDGGDVMKKSRQVLAA